MINTSFNMHEEPIVRSPDDALRSFLQSGVHALVLGPFIVRNSETVAAQSTRTVPMRAIRRGVRPMEREAGSGKRKAESVGSTWLADPLNAARSTLPA